jgi:ribosomal protein S18 acetylase RimI-like enzyme
MEIRPYRAGEEQAIWDVFYDSTRKVLARDYTPEQVAHWAPDDRDVSEWARRISEKNPYVAIINGAVVGFAELEADGHIDDFYVDHEHQRQGVGSALYVAIERAAIRNGFEQIFAESSTTAIEFFKAKGFQIDAELNNLVCGTPAKQFRISKQLKP